ncbi:MAG: hypothetical protein ACLQM6_08725 [Acidobacteriaceae bacterium]
MRIAGIYSFNGGTEAVNAIYPKLVQEVRDVIGMVDATKHKTKKSIEKTMMDRMLYSPRSINKAFKKAFKSKKIWSPVRVPCTYPTTHYLEDYTIRSKNRGAFREMDFVKDNLGVEVQFGKYAFMRLQRMR